MSCIVSLQRNPSVSREKTSFQSFFQGGECGLKSFPRINFTDLLRLYLYCVYPVWRTKGRWKGTKREDEKKKKKWTVMFAEVNFNCCSFSWDSTLYTYTCQSLTNQIIIHKIKSSPDLHLAFATLWLAPLFLTQMW